MQIGTQLRAPHGFCGFAKNIDYFFLKNDHTTGLVTLIEFVENKTFSAEICRITKKDFENALLQQHFVISASQMTMPPWLNELQGINLSTVELSRINSRESNIEKAEHRLLQIQPLILRIDDLLSSNNPIAEIARFARSCTPKQNPRRLQTWLFTYLVFGRNLWSLYPAYHRIGLWSREDNISSIKLGRPALATGPQAGFRVDAEMIQLIEQSYVKHADLGITQRKIYVKAMRTAFECRVIDQKGPLKLYQPEGRPYPSIGQYWYYVKKAFKPEVLGETRYGSQGHRGHVPSLGRFSEGVANLLEKVEADGYYLKQQLQTFTGEALDEMFCIIRITDVASGAIVGVGFAVGRETEKAYRLALFCMSLPKHHFAKLFGIDLGAEEWPCIGLPGRLTVDRGPGAVINCPDVKWREYSTDLTPSYAPRSKAGVESSHPRTPQIEGAPSTVISDFNPVAAAKREILAAVRDNKISNASDRMTPAMIADKVMPNPVGIWNWLDARGRNDAATIAFDDAVRAFLTPVEFSVRPNGVYYLERRFDSSELRETGLLDKANRSGRLNIKGYILDLCVRHAWLEINHRIIEVDAILPLRSADAELYLTVSDLQDIKKSAAVTRSEHTQLQPVNELQFEEAVFEATGKFPDDGKRIKGKRIKAKQNRNSSNESKRATSATKVVI
ncbi:hypothetical protein [Deefgea rivuli]|uniref:hypothetical protein n=1 Tax=Deefgea rivuli TaxID=400948 RepID=UPI000684F6E7|nr:hypothetical protein [Deefgea rivuli]